MPNKSELRYEVLKGEIVVLEADCGLVHRISGEVAEAVRAETSGMVRRSMIRAAIAAAAANGVTTLALPAAAVAVSGVGDSGGIGCDAHGTSLAIRPEFPVDLTASQFADAEYDYRNVVTWTSRSAAADGTWEFELQYKKASAATWTTTVPVNGDRGIQILGLEPGTTYYFRVRERYLGVWSFWSITATLTTAAFEVPGATRVAADLGLSNPALVYYGIFDTPGGYATATFQGRYSANGGSTWSNWVDLSGEAGEFPMTVSGGLPDTLTYQLRAKWNGFFSPAWTIEYMNFNDFWNW